MSQSDSVTQSGSEPRLESSTCGQQSNQPLENVSNKTHICVRTLEMLMGEDLCY